MRLIRGFCAVLALISWVAPGPARPQDEAKKVAKGIDYWAASAARDRVAFASDPSKALDFRKEPALRWSNPVRKTDDGTLFLWTDRGRPEVAACLSHYGTIINHEFQSLSVATMEVRHDGRTVWSPKPGIKPATIPGAPAPAAEAPERLRQMRALARDFKASLDGPTELRPLTQPLYRFDIEKGRADVIDGALFGFVITTDPEALLLIESRVLDRGGAPAWHFSFARMTSYGLRGEHKGREVWRAEPVRDFDDNTKPYWVLGTHPPAH
jgi:hypothetical protein